MKVKTIFPNELILFG